MAAMAGLVFWARAGTPEISVYQGLGLRLDIAVTLLTGLLVKPCCLALGPRAQTRWSRAELQPRIHTGLCVRSCL